MNLPIAPPPGEVSRRDVTSLARGGLINLVGTASQALFAFLFMLVVSRGLGAGGSGALLEAVALFNILATTATLGVTTGFIYSVSRLRAQGREVDILRTYAVGYGPLLVFSMVAATATIVLSEPLASVLGDATHADEIGRYLRTMAWFIPAASVLLATLGATRAYEQMLPTVVLERVTKLGLQAAFVFAAVHFGFNHEMTAMAWTAPVVIALILAVVWLSRLYRLEADFAPAEQTDYRRLFTEFWSFTLPRSFASIFRTCVLWLDVLLVGALISPSAAGIYAVSTRLLQFGLGVAAAVGQVSQPMIGRLVGRGEHAQTRSVYEVATSWEILLSWPQFIAIAIFAAPLLSIFGPDFVGGAPVVVILAASAVIGSAAGPVDMVLLMAGKSMWSLWNTALSLALNLTLNLILIPRMGITGAAIAWAVARVVGNVVPLLQVSLALKLHPFGRRWWTAAICAVGVFGGLGVIVRLALGESLGIVAAYLVVAVGAYGAVLYAVREKLELPTALRAFRVTTKGSASERDLDPPTPGASRSGSVL